MSVENWVYSVDQDFIKWQREVRYSVAAFWIGLITLVAASVVLGGTPNVKMNYAYGYGGVSKGDKFYVRQRAEEPYIEVSQKRYAASRDAYAERRCKVITRKLWFFALATGVALLVLSVRCDPRFA